MTEPELIAQQAMEIAVLKEAVADLNERMGNIRSHIYCIGGPLNDNVRGYSKAQLKPFWDIAELAYKWEAE